jgi:hypothetical protein
MKRLTIIFFSFLFLFFSKNNVYSQDDLYYIHQKKGTERVLKQYIQQILVNNKINIENISEIYVNFIPPMACPRCEGIVIQYNHYIKELSNNNAFIINVLLYKKDKALSKYINRQNFPGNILHIDSTETFVDIFYVNNKTAKLPYMTKISLINGRMIEGIAALGISLDKTLVDKVIQKHSFLDLIDNTDNQPQDEKPISIKLVLDKFDSNKIVNSLLPKYPIDSCFIAKADSLPIVTWFTVNKNGDKLLINNYVENAFFLFTKEAEKWDNPILLYPSENEEKMFIDSNIDPMIYQYCKDINILVSMYLNANFYDKGVYIMASLPKLVLEITDSEEEVSYYNTPVCLLKNYKGEAITYVNFYEDLIDVAKGEYTFLHSDGFFFADSQLFVFPLQKGWPVIGTSALPDSNNNNPFLNEFYDDANTLLIYNTVNDKLVFTAPLDSLYNTYKLGYYYCKPMIKKCTQKYYWVDRTIGKVYYLSNDFINSTMLCDLFNIETIIQQMPYSETLAYMNSYYETYLDRKVVDFEFYAENKCKAIVYDGTNYYLYETDNKNTVTNIRLFPQTINGLRLSDIKFGYSEQNTKVIYGLYQNNQQIVIYLFE